MRCDWKPGGIKVIDYKSGSVTSQASVDLTATPGRHCEWCDYRAMCPERAS